MKPNDKPIKLQTLNNLQAECHTTAKKKGWWDEKRTFGDCIALIHSEASEALEEYRVIGLRSQEDETGKPTGVASEFADVLIRIFDTAAYYNLDLPRILLQKMAYNEKRPYRHGGKRL